MTCRNNLDFPKTIWFNTNSNPVHLVKLDKILLKSIKALMQDFVEVTTDFRIYIKVQGRLTDFCHEICPGGLLEIFLWLGTDRNIKE